MKKRLFPRGISFAILSCTGLGLATDAGAQCRLCSATEPVFQEETPERALTIDIESGLSFDRFAVASSAGGVVVVDPQTGTRQINGALVDLGGFAVSGTASLRGDPGRAVRVNLPSRVTLNTADGDDVELTDLRSDLPANPQLDENGHLRFSFGGRLHVSGRSAGNFRGRIRISAEYQ